MAKNFSRAFLSHETIFNDAGMTVIFFSEFRFVASNDRVAAAGFHYPSLIAVCILRCNYITLAIMYAAMNQSNIADQLSALSREEDDFRKATAKADRERTMIEARLRELRGQQKELSKETRAASDAVGVYQKERGMLLQQKERLQQQLKLERGELEHCAEETKQLVTQDTAAKKKFCETMEDLNDELSDLLMQQEELRVQKMIGSPDTIADLTEHLEAKPEADPEEQKKALEALVEANTNYENAFAKYTQLTSIIKDKRAQAVAEAQSKGQEVRHVYCYFVEFNRVAPQRRHWRTSTRTNNHYSYSILFHSSRRSPSSRSKRAGRNKRTKTANRGSKASHCTCKSFTTATATKSPRTRWCRRESKLDCFYYFVCVWTIVFIFNLDCKQNREFGS